MIAFILFLACIWWLASALTPIHPFEQLMKETRDQKKREKDLEKIWKHLQESNLRREWKLAQPAWVRYFTGTR